MNDDIALLGSLVTRGLEMRRTPCSTLFADSCRTLQDPVAENPSFMVCLPTAVSSWPPNGEPSPSTTQ